MVVGLELLSLEEEERLGDVLEEVAEVEEFGGGV